MSNTVDRKTVGAATINVTEYEKNEGSNGLNFGGVTAALLINSIGRGALPSTPRGISLAAGPISHIRCVSVHLRAICARDTDGDDAPPLLMPT